MQKKVVKKKVVNPIIKKPVTQPVPKSVAPRVSKVLAAPRVSGEGVEKVLIENFVSLQKVMVNLSVRMDNLVNHISQLLNLFEISAKSLAEKGADLGSGYEKRMMEKIDNLADQNKTISRGVALLHEGEASPQQSFAPQRPAPPQMPPQMPPQPQRKTQNMEGYQKSISSKLQRFNKLPQS